MLWLQPKVAPTGCDVTPLAVWQDIAWQRPDVAARVPISVVADILTDKPHLSATKIIALFDEADAEFADECAADEAQRKARR